MLNSKEDLNFILLNIGYSELDADWNWKNVCSPFARIFYVKEGRAKIQIGTKAYELEPDHLYLTPPFTLHDNECDGFFSLYYIHFYEEVLNEESIFDKYDFPLEIKASPLDLLLTQRLLEINPDRYLHYFDPQLYDNAPTFSQNIANNNKMPLHSNVETQGVLYLLISKFLEYVKVKSSNKDLRVNTSLQFIHKNIDKDISIAKLAYIACVTEDHFIRLFKKEMNCTPIKYINQKKMEKAQLLLLTSNTSIRNIALDLSMDNISYFNRIFKQHTGKTPSQYREEYNR